MSKIIEALEKARQDSTLAGKILALDERTRAAPQPTDAPVPRREESGRPPSRPVALPTEVEALDLRGVDPRLQTIHAPLSPFAEQYRSVRSRLERLGKSRDLRVVAVTSAETGEGKSVTVANLGIVFAQDSERRVLLLDADLRRPRLHAMFGLEASPGLSEYLVGEAPLQAIERRLPYSGLVVVPAGRAVGHPGELLASGRFAELLGSYRADYDHVFVDTPPLQPVSDVGFLVEAVDGIVLVVWSGKTRKEAVSKVLEGLPAQKIVGAVLNRADGFLSGSYKYRKGYYAYGGGY